MSCRTVQWGAFASLQRRGGCGINKKSRSHRSAADGVVAHKPRYLRATTPSAQFLERNHFLMARTPLLRKEGNMLARNSFVLSMSFGRHRRRYSSTTSSGMMKAYSVPDILASYQKNNHLGDVCGMISDSFEMFRDEDQLQR